MARPPTPALSRILWVGSRLRCLAGQPNKRGPCASRSVVKCPPCLAPRLIREVGEGRDGARRA